MIQSFISSINPFASALESQAKTPKKKEEIDIQEGSCNILIDGIRNVLSIPFKILFFNSQINSGNISNEVIEKTRDFLHENGLHDVAVSANQYKPQEVWRRIFTNPKTSLLSKCTLGILSGLSETILIPKLTGLGDHYNPASNTVHLFSNDLSIALHECGHAKDFNERKNPMLYSSLKMIPHVGSAATLYHEYKATDNAIAHLKSKKGLGEEVKNAFKTLIPAYASYIAAALSPHPQNSMPFFLDLIKYVIVGHAVGRALAYMQQPEPKETPKIAPVKHLSTAAVAG